jgi:hypothetical protein
MLYKEKLAQEKRDARAREKEEVDRLEADKGQGSCSCKAERERVPKASSRPSENYPQAVYRKEQGFIKSSTREEAEI